MCADGDCCSYEKTWAKFKINGFETDLAHEEIKTYIFDNGLKINLLMIDDDVEFCFKKIEQDFIMRSKKINKFYIKT